MPLGVSALASSPKFALQFLFIRRQREAEVFFYEIPRESDIDIPFR